jgi:hypothetical protein
MTLLRGRVIAHGRHIEGDPGWGRFVAAVAQ